MQSRISYLFLHSGFRRIYSYHVRVCVTCVKGFMVRGRSAVVLDWHYRYLPKIMGHASQPGT